MGAIMPPKNRYAVGGVFDRVEIHVEGLEKPKHYAHKSITVPALTMNPRIFSQTCCRVLPSDGMR